MKRDEVTFDWLAKDLLRPARAQAAVLEQKVADAKAKVQAKPRPEPGAVVPVEEPPTENTPGIYTSGFMVHGNLFYTGRQADAVADAEADLAEMRRWIRALEANPSARLALDVDDLAFFGV